ncbi:MAG: D-alanine--D-alanine ligase [Myxococcales bacterium]|nr:D-alanine--D-alanine ligase [Myxococcales bacterium]
MSTHPFSGRRVGVLMGGPSAEREVSLNTGAGVVAALQESGWDVVAIDWQAGANLADLLTEAKVAVVWNALHGTYGEDGAVQGLTTCLGIPCTGSGILASALAMDKVMSKRIFESNGVPTPRWRLLPTTEEGGPADGSDAAVALADWPLPCVVKPANEGSSVGVSVVEAREQLADAVALARRHHGPVLVEDYIAGTEIFVGILDGAVLGSVEVRPAGKFYDYAAKYQRNDTTYLIPPEQPRAVVARAEELALAAYKALGCSGHCRPDLRISPSGEAFVLEVNTLPGMTKTSLLPKIAKSVGLGYPQLCEKILASAR